MGLERENKKKTKNTAFQLNEQTKWTVTYSLHVDYQSPLLLIQTLEIKQVDWHRK